MIGREKEIKFVKDGFSSFGSLRSAVVLGPEGMGKTLFLNQTNDLHSKSESKSISISPISVNFSDLSSFASSMARNISIGTEVNSLELGKFARSFGSQLVEIESTFRTENNLEGLGESIAEYFVTGLEDAIIHSGLELSDVTPLLIIDDLDKLDSTICDWLCDAFNKKIRDSKLFKRCRFLFSAEKANEHVKQFFTKFGFEKLTQINLPPFNSSQCGLFAKNEGFKIQDNEEFWAKSQGNPLKLLNLLKKPTNINYQENIAMITTDKKIAPVFSDFTEKELNYLLFASYPKRINRYNLEFFCNPREAAFCFNWLKRQKNLAYAQTDGDLILNDEFRNQMLDFHKQEEPAQAEEFSTIATIIDAFTSIFPDSDSHWIPINLQLFDSFTKSLCKSLFDENEFNEIVSFLEEREDTLVISNKQFTLTDDVKLVTQRFIEIGGGVPKENISDLAKAEWVKYQENSAEKRSRLEQEKINLEEEAFDAEKQIISLDELKNELLNNFKNPPKQISKREYTFSTSIILLVLGLGTVGASLFLDSLGTYHAACGVLLSIFGFFWPNVETKKPAVQTAGDSPRLAIETQQRSLTHRMTGLASRVASIRGTLNELNSDLENLDQGINAPYIAD